MKEPSLKFRDKILDWINAQQWKIKPFLNVNLTSYTSFKCRTKADFFIQISNFEELKKIFVFINRYSIPYFILGNGSNTVFMTYKFEGILIQLIGQFKEIEFLNNCQVLVGAGQSSTGLASKLIKKKLGGGEFLATIPGTIGGIVFMNAGAYQVECKDILLWAKVIDTTGQIIQLPNAQMNFDYRRSILSQKKYAVAQVCFQFYRFSQLKIRSKQHSFIKKRKLSQPIHSSTFGSIFRNPPNNYAAKLIENCNLKGKKFGDIIVSPKHANFFENLGNPTIENFDSAISTIQEKVWKKHNIFLIPEVQIIDNKGKKIERFYHNQF